MTATQSGAPRCLIAIEDDLLANFVHVLLDHGEYERRRARTFVTAQKELHGWQPHLAIVDLGLGEGRAAELIGQRGSDIATPVIILAPPGDMKSKLDAFERGADDVLSIPFPPEELIARSLSLVQRRYGIKVPFRPSIKLGALELDILSQQIRVGERLIQLTGHEHSLLYVLAAAAGQPVAREKLLFYMYGDDAMAISSNVIDRYVVDLRQKLGGADAPQRFIETSPGGYFMRTGD